MRSGYDLISMEHVMVLSDLLFAYLPIFIFVILAVIIAVFMICGSLLANIKKPSKDKLAPYECGFEPFTDTRSKFDVRFYLVALLFIIFDLCVAFLFPWAMALGRIGVFEFWSMVTFLAILIVGFVYVWKKGALDWE